MEVLSVIKTAHGDVNMLGAVLPLYATHIEDFDNRASEGGTTDEDSPKSSLISMTSSGVSVTSKDWETGYFVHTAASTLVSGRESARNEATASERSPISDTVMGWPPPAPPPPPPLALDLRVEELPSLGTKGHPHHCAEACKYFRRKQGCRAGKLCKSCHVCYWRRTAVEGTIAGVGQSAAASGAATGTRAGLETIATGFKGVTMDTLEQLIRLQLYCDEQTIATEPGNPCAHELPGAATQDVTDAYHITVPSIDDKDFGRDEQAASFGSIGHPHSCAPPCKYMCKRNGCRDGIRCIHCHICQWKSKSAVLAMAAVASEGGGATVSQTASEDTGVGGAFALGAAVVPTVFVLGGLASMGSFGHPLKCGVPCKYFNRKTGCRDGPKCVCCHLCQFERPARVEARAARRGISMQAASVGEDSPHMEQSHLPKNPFMSMPCKVAVAAAQPLIMPALLAPSWQPRMQPLKI